MNFLLDVNNIDLAKPIENFSDMFLYGGRMLLIGMATVFSVLILLDFLAIPGPPIHSHLKILNGS